MSSTTRPLRTLAILLLLTTLAAAAAAQTVGPDVVGIYFDPAYTVTEVTNTAVPHVATGYLVLHNPSQTGGGLGGWECRIEVSGDTPVNWVPQGQAINYDTPPDFVVAFTEPLPVPGAEVLLATFDMYVADASPRQVSLLPKQWSPSLPDAMSYIPWDDKELLTPMATATGSSVVASYNWGPWCEVSRTGIIFGSQPVDNVFNETVTVTNTGGGTLIVDPSVVGDDGFGVGNASLFPRSLGPDESVIVQVRFAPSEVRDYSAQLELGTPCGTIPLTAAGREAISSYHVSPTTVDFGNVISGGTYYRQLDFRNSGETTLEIDAVTNCPEVSVSPGGPYTLAPGALRRLNVVFTPSGSGPFACDVLFGAGYDAVPVLAQVAASGELVEVVPGALDFGTTHPGGRATRSFRVTNNADVPIRITPTLTDPGQPFVLVNASMGSPATIYAGQSRLVEVAYEPQAAGTHATGLRLAEIDVTVPLSGRCETPAGVVSVQPTALDFGTFYVGGFYQRTVTVINNTDAVVALSPTIVQDAPEAFEISAGYETGNLAPGEYRNIWVVARPMAAATYTGTLVAGPAVPAVPLSVTGRTYPTRASVSPASLEFGSWPVGAEAEMEVRITNNDWRALDMAVSLDPAGPPFDVSAGASIGVVPPYSHATVRVRFRPTAIGAFATELHLSPDLDPVPVWARAEAEVPLCNLSGETLLFPPTATGQGVSRLLTVTNTGTGTLSLDPATGCDAFSVPAGPVTIPPGGSADVTVVFRPEFVGSHACVLDLGAGACADVLLEGEAFVGPPGGDGDRVGLYFDQAFTTPWITGVAAGEPVEAYLVLRNPSVADNISGWELQVLSDADILLQDAQLAVGSHNYSALPEFTVGFETPLPPGAEMLLGTLTFVPSSVPDNAPLALVPRRNPSLPDAMAYSHGPEHALHPMYPVDSDPFVAWMNYRDPTVGIDDRPGDDDVPDAGPAQTRLLPNYPNPFNPETTVRFELARDGHLRIDVFDVMGRRVARLLDEDRVAGTGQVTWHGRDRHGRTLPSGAYYVRLETGTRVDTRKVMLLK
jgi:hypothetical protein